jgi:hypothetical protein
MLMILWRPYSTSFRSGKGSFLDRKPAFSPHRRVLEDRCTALSGAAEVKRFIEKIRVEIGARFEFPEIE